MKHVKLILVVLGLALIFASLCSAEPMEYRDTYYSVPNPVYTDLRPIWIGPDGAANPWQWKQPPYNPCAIGGGSPENPDMCLPPDLAQNSTLAFAMENRKVPLNIKSVTLYIEYSGAGNLVVARYGSGRHVSSPDSLVVGEEGAYVTGSGGKLYVNWPIAPQPDWEWILVKSVGGNVHFDKVHFYSDCVPVPSLTQWGLIGLGVLILAAGAMVIVRRRKAVATA